MLLLVLDPLLHVKVQRIGHALELVEFLGFLFAVEAVDGAVNSDELELFEILDVILVGNEADAAWFNFYS